MPADLPAPTMRALSIRQPWLWAILHAGKAVENRDWSGCNYRGPVLLHASKGCTHEEYASSVRSIQLMREDIGAPPARVPALDQLPRGCFVGIARIEFAMPHPTEGLARARGVDDRIRTIDWSRGYAGYRVAGALGLELADVRELPPLPFKGALGLFSVWLSGLPGAEVYEAAWRELAAKGGRRAG